MKALRGRFTDRRRPPSLRWLVLIGSLCIFSSLTMKFLSDEQTEKIVDLEVWAEVFDRIGFSFYSKGSTERFVPARIGAQLAKGKYRFVTRNDGHLFLSLLPLGGRLEIDEDSEVIVIATIGRFRAMTDNCNQPALSVIMFSIFFVPFRLLLHV